MGWGVTVIVALFLIGICFGLCLDTNGSLSVDTTGQGATGHRYSYNCCQESHCTHTLGGVPIQLNPCAFFQECYNHPEGVDENADFLFDGICKGFRIVDSDPTITSYVRSNYSSIRQGELRDAMSENLITELSEGKVTRVDTQPFCVHAMGGVRKKDGSLRPITDCKRPIGHSINTVMHSTAIQFRFKTLDYVSTLIKKDCYLGVVDISKAYRSVHIYPPHRQYHGFEWEGNWYVDNRLSFGLRCAPYIFTCLSDFVVRTMTRYGFPNCTNYIDDFLCYGNDRDECTRCQDFMVRLLNYLGFDVSISKLVRPSQIVTYLGVTINTCMMEFSLPQEKLERLFPLLDSFRNRTTATRHELQSLVGYLSHCSYVVKGGRVFTRRLINLIRCLPHDKAIGHLDSMIKSDLDWWLTFTRVFNGKAGIIQDSDSGMFLCTDASLTGFGAVCANDFFLGTWKSPRSELRDWAASEHWAPPPSYVSLNQDNINILEFWPVVWAVVRWGHLWRNQKIILYTDNNQVLYAINSNKSRDWVAMGWLREIFWASFVHNFHIVARHIPSRDNILADCLSRFSDNNARRLGIYLLHAGHFHFRNVAGIV